MGEVLEILDKKFNSMKARIDFKNGLVLFLVSFLFYSCGEAEKGNSNETAMFMANTKHTGKFGSVSVKKQPRTVWKVKTNGQVISSPVIANGLLFIGSEDSKMYAINKTSGEIKWEFETQGAINSTPLITNGKVLFLSYDGFFYALNQFNGNLIWKFKTDGESTFDVKDYYNGSFKPDFWDFYLSSAVHDKGLVYFGSSDSNVYALDIETGKKIWNYKTEGSIHSSPALYEGKLVIGSWDGNIYCLNAKTGELNWSFATEKDIEQYIWLGIQASPSIEDGVAYIGSRDAKFYALHVATGDTLWTKNEFDRSWMPSSAAIGKHNIYTGSSDSFGFYSINRKDGSINYKTDTNSYTFSSPALDDEMAYIGSANGRLYGIERVNGEIKWEFKTEGVKIDSINIYDATGKLDTDILKDLTKSVNDMPTLSGIYEKVFINTGAILSSPVIFDQTIYFGSSDGYVYAISDK